MNYGEAYEKLDQYGQLHVLDFYEELNEEQKMKLLKQIEEVDFNVLKYGKAEHMTDRKGKITPLAAMQLQTINQNKEHFTQIGKEAIRQNKVAAVLLAGGMGTRLGSDAPKGMYDIGLTQPVYIFQRMIENLLDVVKLCGCYVPLYIMTSDKNHTATVAFFEEKKYFGYRKESITFFIQDVAPVSDLNGMVYMEEKGKIATSPNGNAGWFSSLAKAGYLKQIKADGIEWINVFAVDNVLQRIADPCFVGAVIDSGCASGAKVVKKKAPDERVGVMCQEDGKPSIVEYYELTDELMNAKDETGEPAYNFGVILNYLFREKELEQIMEREFPQHVARKKIDHIDRNGNFITADTPNGYKYETLVLDMIHEISSCLPYEVDRPKEFAPIKNKTGVDSVESARELCIHNGIRL